jgi:hypothetical protein
MIKKRINRKQIEVQSKVPIEISYKQIYDTELLKAAYQKIKSRPLSPYGGESANAHQLPPFAPAPLRIRARRGGREEGETLDGNSEQ